jgi:hypothetical protein
MAAHFIVLPRRDLEKLGQPSSTSFLSMRPNVENQAVTFVYHFARPYTNTPTKHQENIAAVGLDGYRVLVEGEGFGLWSSLIVYCVLKRRMAQWPR